MKNYLSLAILVIIAGVLDYFCLSNLGQPVLPSHRIESLTQAFNGGLFDWVGLVAFNVTVIVTGFFLAVEKDFYEETTTVYYIGFLLLCAGSLTLIRWA